MTNSNISNATLHIFSKPISEIEYQRLRAIKKDTDCVLLTRDACYSLLAGFNSLNNVFALKEDCDARGINSTLISFINYEDWVNLTLKYKNTLSW